MKAFIVATLLAITAVTLFTACERNDYQHPMHRK
jgi:hypothetical protein